MLPDKINFSIEIIPETSEIKDELERSPSIEIWENEISNIINGERDGYLDDLGSIRAYIEKELLSILSTNKKIYSKSVELLKKAIENTIQLWEPMIERDKEYFANILEIIEVYGPPSGYKKAFEFLSEWKYKIQDIHSTGSYNSRSDLVSRSLSALGRYFQTPPIKTSGEYERYNSYIKLLETYLFDPIHCGYSAIKLISLPKYELKDKIIGDAIKKNPQILSSLIGYSFSNENEYDLKDNLKVLYEHVLSGGDEAQKIFEERLNIYGFKVESLEDDSDWILDESILEYKLEDYKLSNLKKQKAGIFEDIDNRYKSDKEKYFDTNL